MPSELGSGPSHQQQNWSSLCHLMKKPFLVPIHIYTRACMSPQRVGPCWASEWPGAHCRCRSRGRRHWRGQAAMVEKCHTPQSRGRDKKPSHTRITRNRTAEDGGLCSPGRLSQAGARALPSTSADLGASSYSVGSACRPLGRRPAVLLCDVIGSSTVDVQSVTQPTCLGGPAAPCPALHCMPALLHARLPCPRASFHSCVHLGL